MELVLTLIRNLLAIPNEDSRLITSSTEYRSHLQEDFVGVLYQENFYELILLFCQVRTANVGIKLFDIVTFILQGY
jgi:hypothetical protein